MKAPFNMGFSKFFLNFLITFAGALPVSENIKAVFPFNCDFKSPKSLSTKSIALARRVFFTTESFMLDLKHSLLNFDVEIASKPEQSVIYIVDVESSSDLIESIIFCF